MKHLGGKFEEQIQGGRILFRQYEVRLASLQIAVDACMAQGDAETLLPALEEAVVDAVLARKEPVEVRLDERFVRIPPNSRMMLGRALRACLVKFGEPQGRALLERVRDTWAEEQPRLAAEMSAGLTELAGG